MSGLGKFSSGAGAPSFGPTSVFNKRKGANTPPMSRQTSSVNMFSALNDAESAAAEPERPKLNLQARTKPIEGEAEAEAEAEPEAEADPASAPMGPAAAQAKIDSDMKELWGEKDAGGSRNADDIVEYFTALPEEHRGMLALRLVEDVFRIAKFPDAQVVASGLGKALEAGISVDILRRG
jgi:translation initiation factor 4G